MFITSSNTLKHRQKWIHNSTTNIHTYSTLSVFKAPILGDKIPENPIFGKDLQINNKTKHSLAQKLLPKTLINLSKAQTFSGNSGLQYISKQNITERRKRDEQIKEYLTQIQHYY